MAYQTGESLMKPNKDAEFSFLKECYEKYVADKNASLKKEELQQISYDMSEKFGRLISTKAIKYRIADKLKGRKKQEEEYKVKTSSEYAAAFGWSQEKMERIIKNQIEGKYK